MPNAQLLPKPRRESPGEVRRSAAPEDGRLAAPRLISSYEGTIDIITFAFPRYALSSALADGYKSVISALRLPSG
jgi:hypothetical protein